jgi:valyl-tRNA synthetase
MESQFTPQKYEKGIYDFWEKSGLLSSDNGKPYTILMPPPNANASLHAGHGMYIVDDILIRYKRLRGYASLWIPGVDHAGFETQYVYEKYLAKQGKSRMNYDRQTFYNNVFQFVKDNSGLIYKQFKKLGFLADWNKSVFTLDEQVLQRVFVTFKRMESEGLVYRDNYIVNYCTYCGTSLSELEIEHKERKDPLYYMRYGPFVLATVRPETKFGDTALAVNPKDKRYQRWVGKEIEVTGLLGVFKIKVIADDIVDPKFGTGVVKVTPAHDPIDFEIGRRHGLATKQVIGLDGRLNQLTGPYAGFRVKIARERIASDLTDKGLIDKIDTNYFHAVAICYKCGRDLEPMITPNWYIRVKELKQPVIEAVKKEKIKFYPKRYKKQMFQWLKVMHDWPISRQIAWGIRIPVWYKVNNDACNSNIIVWWLDKDRNLIQGNIEQFLKKKISLTEIKKGLQKIYVPTDQLQPDYVVSRNDPGEDCLPETDTFDTWFSSGQWPLVTLKDEEFKTRFPTDMMGTYADILTLWVSRMIMFSLYLKKKVPFKDVYLWSMVADAKGTKMSKSKGNVINPIDLVDKYGADAFRASLIFGTAQGGTVILSEDKVRGMRNFTNKVWNMGRFIYMNRNQKSKVILRQAQDDTEQNRSVKRQKLSKTDKELKKEFAQVKKKYLKFMNGYQFSMALGLIYEFLWHQLADVYIEELKDEIRNGNINLCRELKQIYLDSLILLHPFMPFVTEAIWQVFNGEKNSILKIRI